MDRPLALLDQMARRNGGQISKLVFFIDNNVWFVVIAASSCVGLGTSIMRDWPPIRVRETPVYASSLRS